MDKSLLSFVFLCCGIGQVQSVNTLPAVNGTGVTLNVSIVIMDGLFISEATIPFDVFKHVPSGMNTYFVAESMNAITTFYGAKLMPHYTFANAPTADILVVPSGIGSHHSFLTEWYGGATGANGIISGKTMATPLPYSSNPVSVTYYGNSTAMINYVRTASASAKIVTSHCWGAFTLADAGVLDGKIATTFPGYTNELEMYYPAISSVVADQRMVVSGKVLTSNGGLAAFEACLYLVRHIYGDNVTKTVSDGLVYSADNHVHSKIESYKVSPAPGTLATVIDTVVNVGILLTDGNFISEPVGPFDVFAHMGAKMNVFFVAKDMSKKTSFYGAEMSPHFTFASSPRVDLLVVPSGIGSHWSFMKAWYNGTIGANGVITGLTKNGVSVTYYGNDTSIIDWVRTTASTAKYVTSHCWGAFTLADAGLLDGKTATTFPGYEDELIQYYPAIAKVVTDNRIVQDGNLITSSGGVAAYEAAVYAVKLIYGVEYAKKVANSLVYAKDNYDFVNTAHVVNNANSWTLVDAAGSTSTAVTSHASSTSTAETSHAMACAPMLLFVAIVTIFAIV